MSSRLCPFCMQITDGDTCPHCGKNVNYTGQPMHLPAGYVVSGAHPYVLGAALGQGGFGITYIALDMITNQRVAIKEYYPTYCSARTDNSNVTAYSNQEEVYLKGKERFLEEARTLKSLSDLKSIVNVLDFFEANNSAYLVMEFLDGDSLKEHAAKHGKFPAQKFLEQIRPLMEDIHRMHERGVIHRDIAPDNIILLPDGQMKLIDFGSARSYLGDKSMTVVVKKGFAPVEQYMSKGSSASTDVYALAATIYYCITGKVPPDSAERQYDGIPLVSPGSLGVDISLKQEKALTKALEIHQKDRIQSVQKFLENLKEKESIRQKSKQEKARSKQVDPKPAPNLSAPLKSASTAADAVPVPEKKLKDAKKPDEKSVQSIQDRRSEQKIIQKSTKSDHKKTDEPTHPGKRTALKIAAVILVVITVVGFALNSRRPKETEEQRTAVLETTEAPTEATLPIPTEAAVEEPAWKKNVLMADVSYDEDRSEFWAERKSSTSDELSDYFSKRPIFNTEIPKNKVTDVFFLDSLSTAPEKVYDVSANQDGLVLAWTEENEKGALNLYIAGEGGVNGEEACRVLFSGYTELETVHFNHCFFTDNAQDMSSMFEYCRKLTTIDLECLNTASTINMSDMFRNCEQLTSLDLSTFDTAKVTNMFYMFCECEQLTSLDLSSFDTSSVTDMQGMFFFCKQLTSLDLRSFDTSKVTDMSEMFYYCEKLTSLDLSTFDTSNVTNYEDFMDNGKRVNGRPWKELFDRNKEDPSVESAGEELAWKNNILMADVTFDEDYTRFWNEEFKKFSYEIYDFFAKRPVFNTDIPRKKVTDVFFLDSIAAAPETVYDVSANQDGSVLAWTEKNRKGALNLYIAGEGGVNGEEACRALFYGYEELTSINFNNSFFTDTTQDLSAMFGYCKKLETIELGSLNTESATNMSKMFSNCESLKSLDLSTFDTSNVTDMSSMFSGCQKLKTIDISSFDTSNVENMSYMFSYLKSMKAFDVSNFDTSKVTNMNGLFSGCSNEKFTVLDLSNFDTSKVLNMSSMFSGCRWITSLDLTNFDTSKVTNMQFMFYYCRRLTSLDLSSFDTSNVTYMNSMFEMCSMLPVLEISHFNTAKVINMGHMFYKCGYLKKMDVTQFDVTSVKNTENMFFGCDKLPLEYKKLGGKYIWST